MIKQYCSPAFSSPAGVSLPARCAQPLQRSRRARGFHPHAMPHAVGRRQCHGCKEPAWRQSSPCSGVRRMLKLSIFEVDPDCGALNFQRGHVEAKMRRDLGTLGPPTFEHPDSSARDMTRDLARSSGDAPHRGAVRAPSGRDQAPGGGAGSSQGEGTNNIL